MQPLSNKYELVKDNEPPTIRGKLTHINADENAALVPKEIILEADKQNSFSIGKSNKRDAQVKAKAVSNNHCIISYS